MKVTCEREKLLSAFQIAATVAPSRSPKTILQHVKLEASGMGAILMATDMEVGVRIDVTGIDVEAGGSAVLPVDRFGLILRENSDEKIRIETDSRGVTVKGQRSEFKLPAENPDEFPNVQAFKEDKFHQLPAKLFKEMIRRTLFATDQESTRYALGGVLFEFEAKKITAVGTDGRRLAKMEGIGESVGGHLTGDFMTIIPTRSLQLMDRALTDSDGEIQVAARANDVLVKSSRATIYSRLVEGRYPKWRDVFPQRTNALRIDFAVGPLYSTHRQAAIVTNADSRGIDFTFGDGTLVLTASTAELGQSRVELPISYTGTPITVTLDHRYVNDFLRVLDPEKNCTLEIENAESAALFMTDDGYGYVVMPLARDRQ